MHVNVLKAAAKAISFALVFCAASDRAAAETRLTIALNASINTLDPAMTGTVPTDLSVLSHVYPSLVERGADLKLHPNLAVSWQQIDPDTWRFTLVKNARFMDGEPIDATAVKWNIERMLNPATKARTRSWYRAITSVRVQSPSVVDISTAKPTPAIVQQLSMLFMLPPKWAATHNPAIEAMSGGAYQIADYVSGDHVLLKRNPSYWGEKPEFDQVLFRVMPDAASRVAALLGGDIDYAQGFPTSELAYIEHSGRARTGTVPSSRSVFIKLNAQTGPFKGNALLRQAVNLAVDKDGITKSLFDGHANVSTCQVITPDYIGFNPGLHPYAYRPDLARKLIEKSRFDVRTPIEMDVPAGWYLQAEEVAQVVAAQLAKVGLKVEIRMLNYSAYMNKYVKAHQMAPMQLTAFAWPSLDADGLLSLFAPGNPYAYWDDRAFGQVLDEARGESDTAKRLADYATATDVMCREAPVIFLYQQPLTFATSERVTWSARGDDWVRAADFRISGR